MFKGNWIVGMPSPFVAYPDEVYIYQYAFWQCLIETNTDPHEGEDRKWVKLNKTRFGHGLDYTPYDEQDAPYDGDGTGVDFNYFIINQVFTGTAIDIDPICEGFKLYVISQSDSDVTLNFPTYSLNAIYDELVVIQEGAGQITFTAPDGSGNAVKSLGDKFKSAGQNAVVRVKKLSDLNYTLSGDLTT